MVRRLLVGLATLRVLIAPSSAGAFDGERKGFLVGMGLGPEWTWASATQGPDAESVSRAGFAFELRFGVAPTNQLALTLFSSLAVFKVSELGSAYSDYIDRIGTDSFGGLGHMVFAPIAFTYLPYQASHSTMGAGITYYLDPAHPSFFLGGGLGFAIIADPVESDLFGSDSAIGGEGLYFSGGYEFQDHLSAELQLILGRASERPTTSIFGLPASGPFVEHRKATSLVLKLNLLAY